ncbi:transposase [Rhodococcus sp. 15-1154-1]|nr:IS481 family transposase [Rhodococcus sp. 15-1154-1]OZE97239.1 transposase [Rhodococcus sp. 15-1154-1]
MAVEVRLRAVIEVRDGAPIVEVAERFGVCRQTVAAWRTRYEHSGLDGLVDISRRPRSSPNRISPAIEASICEMRRRNRRWGARRIAHELRDELGSSAPSRTTVHRALTRNGLINPQEQQHKRIYKRWQREAPMHLWQLDLVGGIYLVGGRECKILTGIDDHSRFIVVAAVLDKPSGAAVCAAFVAAMQRWGVPSEVLTDNGKQFTGRFTRPMPAEVLFERTCREYGISARLTKRRSPTTTGKIERFHRTLRRELLDEVGPFATIEAAQLAVDEWVHSYNTQRPHQSLDMATPVTLFRSGPGATPAAPNTSAFSGPESADAQPLSVRSGIVGGYEIDLRIPAAGVVDLVGAQQVWIGKGFAGRTVTLWADLATVHAVIDGEVVNTVASRLTSADLDRLTMRGARAGQPAPALPAFDPGARSGTAAPIEVDRTATRDGLVTLLGHQLALGPDTAGTRVTLRIEGGLIHAIAGNHVIKTTPNPLGSSDNRRLTRVRRATTPLPPPPPSGPQRVHRRVPIDGVVMVAGQRLRVGRTHAGTVVTVVVEDHHFRVLDGTAELSLHARTATKPIRNFNAHRPRDR